MRFLIYYFIFISSSLYAQDSLKIYSVPKWKLDRLLDNFFYDYPQCLETTVKLDSTVQALKAALQAGEQVIEIRTQERDIKAAEATELRTVIEKDAKIHKEEKKAERKKGFRKGLSIGLVIALGVLLL